MKKIEKENIEQRTLNAEHRSGEGEESTTRTNEAEHAPAFTSLRHGRAEADSGGGKAWTPNEEGNPPPYVGGYKSGCKGGGGISGVVLKKARGNAKWHALSVEQRELLEEWLFEDKLSYDAALDKAQKELGFKGSRSSIRRFYERTSEERMLGGLVTSQEQVDKIRETPGSAEELRAAGMKIVAHLFLQQVTQAPEHVKEWSRLAKLLLQSESNEIRFRLKREENELRRKAMEFAREKFHYDIMEQGKKVLPELQKAWEAGLTEYERNARTNNLRRRMWPEIEKLPDLLPENEEEEKQMAAQKIIDDAARAKHHEWWYQRFGSPEAKARIAAEREAAREADRMEEEQTGRVDGTKQTFGVEYPYGQ